MQGQSDSSRRDKSPITGSEKNSLRSYLKGLGYAQQRKTAQPTSSKVSGTSFLETHSMLAVHPERPLPSFTLDKLGEASEGSVAAQEPQKHRTDPEDQQE